MSLHRPADRTSVFGTENVGSNPTGGTKQAGVTQSGQSGCFPNSESQVRILSPALQGTTKR